MRVNPPWKLSGLWVRLERGSVYELKAIRVAESGYMTVSAEFLCTKVVHGSLPNKPINNFDDDGPDGFEMLLIHPLQLRTESMYARDFRGAISGWVEEFDGGGLFHLRIDSVDHDDVDIRDVHTGNIDGVYGRGYYYRDRANGWDSFGYDYAPLPKGKKARAEVIEKVRSQVKIFALYEEMYESVEGVDIV